MEGKSHGRLITVRKPSASFLIISKDGLDKPEQKWFSSKELAAEELNMHLHRQVTTVVIGSNTWNEKQPMLISLDLEYLVHSRAS